MSDRVMVFWYCEMCEDNTEHELFVKARQRQCTACGTLDTIAIDDIETIFKYDDNNTM
jgi:uncharacterized Zn finger protein